MTTPETANAELTRLTALVTAALDRAGIPTGYKHTEDGDELDRDGQPITEPGVGIGGYYNLNIPEGWVTIVPVAPGGDAFAEAELRQRVLDVLGLAMFQPRHEQGFIRVDIDRDVFYTGPPVDGHVVVLDEVANFADVDPGALHARLAADGRARRVLPPEYTAEQVRAALAILGLPEGEGWEEQIAALRPVRIAPARLGPADPLLAGVLSTDPEQGQP